MENIDIPKPETGNKATTNLKPPSPPWYQSAAFAWVLKSLIALIIALLIFQLGMFVGFRKAGFSYIWGDSYHRVFGGPQSGLMHDFIGQDFMNGHGISGTIAQIDGHNITVMGSGGAEINIAITDRTSIIKGRSPVQLAGLQVDDTVTVIGRPNDDGIIFAEIIRILDSADRPMNIPNLPPRY